MSQQEECLEVENTRKEIDGKFALHMRDEYFYESEEEESKHEKSAEESEHDE